MANEKQNKRPQQPNLQDTSSVENNKFFKGMTKDPDMVLVGKENWTHAINAINNSAIGDAGVIGNEPANLLCADVPYEVIGGIHLFGDKWVLYSTDDTSSEIGIFDDSKCEYKTFINDPCLNFNRKYLVTGASKENFDCSWQVYWDDHALNPSRTLNIGPVNDDGWFTDINVPWISQAAVIDENGTPQIIEDYDDVGAEPENCITFIPIEPKQLDCDRIRLSPYMDVPCINVKKSDSGGQLKNGSYQVFIAYTLNENKIGDYIAMSEVQPMFDHDDMSGSLEINITNLDTEFEFFELVILANNQMQNVAKRIGFYSTMTVDGNFRNITIDFIDPKLQTIAIDTLPAQNPRYERSDKMYALNDYLIRQGPYEQFDFNYQCQANEIETMWTSTMYPDTYYRDGGNKPTFMRDEQYSFFIRFVYKTGERSNSYHIPGRSADVYPDGIPVSTYFPGGDRGNNLVGTYGLDPNEDENWEVINTACEVVGVPGIGNTTNDGGTVIAKGYMGYWESTERYPSRDPERWCELCGDKIRHHKFPDEQTSGNTRRSIQIPGQGQFITVLGVEFSNIARPTNNDGSLITNITGYEILVGSRKGAKSIIAKGLVRTMRGYNPSVEDAETGVNIQGVFANYPFNDLSRDPFILTQDSAVLAVNAQGPATWLGNGSEPLSLMRHDLFTFHSPETSFNRPFLSPYEIKSYGITRGNSVGRFKFSEDHPKHKLIRDIAAIIAAVLGAGYAIQEMRGPKSQKSKGSTAISLGQQPGAYDNRDVDIDQTGTVSQSPLTGTFSSFGGVWTPVIGGWASANAFFSGGGDMTYNLNDSGTDNFNSAPPDPNDGTGSGALLNGVAPGPGATSGTTPGTPATPPVGSLASASSVGQNATDNMDAYDDGDNQVGQEQAGDSLTNPLDVANITGAITAPISTPLSWFGVDPPLGGAPQEQSMILAATPMDPLAPPAAAEETYLRDQNQRHTEAIKHNQTRSYMGPVREIESKESKYKGLPGLLQIIFKIHTFLNMMTTGGQEIIELVYNLMSHQDYALKYNAYGLYHSEQCHYNPMCDNYQAGVSNRSLVDNAVYISNAFQNLSANIRINNLQRPKTVVIQTTGNGTTNFGGVTFRNPGLPVITGNCATADGLTGGDNSRQLVSAHRNPTQPLFTCIAAHYVGLKVQFENQYGQLDGILQLPTGCAVQFNPNPTFAIGDLTSEPEVDATVTDRFTSPIVYGGDCYINRYSEKVIMPFFWDFLKGQPDMYNFNYYEHQNIPNTRFWYNGDKYNLSGLVQPFTDLTFSWLSDPTNPGLPSAMHNLDRAASDAGISSGIMGAAPGMGGGGGGGYPGGLPGGAADGSGTADPATYPTGTGTAPSDIQKNGMFTIKGAYMYTHSSGINEFFVESEINTALRDWEDSRGKRHYDFQEYGDLMELFHADIIKDGNYYKYDHSLSKTNFFTEVVSFSFIQDQTYDPIVAEDCLTHYPKRVIYSLQAQQEAKKDFWRVFLPNNYRDFKNPINVIKPISKTGALILFPHYAPQQFQGVDSLQTDGDIKITIGDAGLFNQPFQNVVNADLSHEYGSCESMRSVINTPTGLYYISQAQGKIFSYTGSLEAISDLGMKQWFNSYLPSQLIKAFPNLEGTVLADNPLVGVGCQSVYDPNFDLVYFMKRDYAPLEENECLEYIDGIGFVINNTACYGYDQLMSCPDDTYTLYEPGELHPQTQEVLTDFTCCNWSSVTNIYEDQQEPTIEEIQGPPIYDYSGIELNQIFHSVLEGCFFMAFDNTYKCKPRWCVCTSGGNAASSMWQGWMHQTAGPGGHNTGPVPMGVNQKNAFMITDAGGGNCPSYYSNGGSIGEVDCGDVCSDYEDDWTANVYFYCACDMDSIGENTGPNPNGDFIVGQAGFYSSLGWSYGNDMSNGYSHPYGKTMFKNYAGLPHGTSLATTNNGTGLCPVGSDNVPQIEGGLLEGTTYEFSIDARLPKCSSNLQAADVSPDFPGFCFARGQQSSGQVMRLKLWGGDDSIADGNIDDPGTAIELAQVLINDDNANYYGQLVNPDDYYNRFTWVTYRGTFTPTQDLSHVMISSENGEGEGSAYGFAMVQNLRIFGPPDVDVTTLPILGYDYFDACECPTDYDMVFAEDYENGITTIATEADCLAGNVDVPEYANPITETIDGETQTIEAGDYQMLVENPSFEMSEWDWTYVRTTWNPISYSYGGGFVTLSNPWTNNEDMLAAMSSVSSRGMWAYTPAPWIRCQQDSTGNILSSGGTPLDPITGNRALTADTHPATYSARGNQDLVIFEFNNTTLEGDSSVTLSNVQDWEDIGMYVPMNLDSLWPEGSGGSVEAATYGVDNNAYEGDNFIGMVHYKTNSSDLNWQEGVSQQLSIPLIAGSEYQGSIKIRRNRWTDPLDLLTDTAKLILLGGNEPCCLTETLWVSVDSGSLADDTWTIQNINFTPTGNWQYIQFMIQTSNESFNVVNDDYSWANTTDDLLPANTFTCPTCTKNDGGPAWTGSPDTLAYLLIDDFSGFAFKEDTDIRLPDTQTCNCPEDYEPIEWPILDGNPDNIVVYEDLEQFEIDCLNPTAAGAQPSVMCRSTLVPGAEVVCVFSEETTITGGGCEPPTYTDDVTPVELTDTEYFKDVSWTVSYDPKAKAWISFHDWHPDLVFPSLDHFLTTKYSVGDASCPPGYFLNEDGLCENTSGISELADVDRRYELCQPPVAASQPPLDIVFAIDTSGGCSSNSPVEDGTTNALRCSDGRETNQWQLHLQFVNQVALALNDGMQANRVQIGVRTFGQFTGICRECYNYYSGEYNPFLPEWLNNLSTADGLKRYSDDYVGITFTDEGMFSGNQLMEGYGDWNDDPTEMMSSCYLPGDANGFNLVAFGTDGMTDPSELLWEGEVPAPCQPGSPILGDIEGLPTRPHDVISYAQTPGNLRSDGWPYSMTSIPFTLGAQIGYGCIEDPEQGGAVYGGMYLGCLTQGMSHFWSPETGTNTSPDSGTTSYLIHNSYHEGYHNRVAPYEGGYRGGYNQLLDMNRSMLGDRSNEPGYRRLLVILTNGWSAQGGYQKRLDLYGNQILEEGSLYTEIKTPCHFKDYDAELIVVYTNARGACLNELTDDEKDDLFDYACITEEENDISPRAFAFGLGIDFDTLSTSPDRGISLDLDQELGTIVEPGDVQFTNNDWDSPYAGQGLSVNIPENTPSSEWVDHFRSQAVEMGYTEEWGQDRYDEWILQGGGGYGSLGQAIWEVGGCSEPAAAAQNFVQALSLASYAPGTEPNNDIECDCDEANGYIQVGSGNPNDPNYPPYCANITCDCKSFAQSIGVPESDVTMTGDCDNVTEWAEETLWGLSGPTASGYVNTNPAMCNYDQSVIVDPTTVSGSIWRHNVRCDLFSNYYYVQYPWEIEFVESTGQMVNTVRNVEYEMEAYIYKQAKDAEGELIFGYSDCDSRWHDLDFNFNRAYIYNTEQVSGYLHLNISPKNNAPEINQYPAAVIDVNDNSNSYIDILYSKEEQKYRFNQFWDITANRGEIITPTGDFDSNAAAAQQAIMWTELNGYVRDLNSLNLEYDKPPIQRKKFRHYWNKIVLRREPEINEAGEVILETRKMLLKLDNTKVNLSMR